MRKLYLLRTLFVLATLCGNTLYSQDFSNKGRDFWLCFPQHVPSGNSLATLSIWITSDKASSGTVSLTNGTFLANFNIAANALQEIQIPHSIGHISNAESGSIIKKSIRIKVDDGKSPVVAYAQQWGSARSAATLLLPVNVLGKRYYAVSFTQSGVSSGTYIAQSQFQVIATKPNTTVKITPRRNGVVGNPFSINFPLTGDMYQYQADEDLTGTLIESTASASGGCVPIAVFSGSSNITFGTNTCNSSNTSYDPLFQQQYPITSWGKNFGFIPFADYPNGNPYRVLASEDNTAVFFNGAQVATLNAGEIYPAAFTSSPVVIQQPTSISADKPIAVAQYAQRLSCGGGGYGDPDMVMLNPIEQNINDITIFSSSQQNITRQWVNVLIKSSGISSFRISKNGGPLTPPTGSWSLFAPLPGYSYLKEFLSGPGSYRLVSDSGYNAIAYGFGSNYESYAYSAGTNIKDLYTQLGFTTPYGNAALPAACIGTSSKIKISLPYKADSIRWKINQLPGNPADTITNYPPSSFDSTTVANGKTLYWYSLPSYYLFNVAGTYPVTIITYSANGDGCGTEQEYNFDVQVYDKPVSDFTFSTDGCVTNPVLFTDNSTPGARPITKWAWDFGDANTGSTTNPSHIYAAPGTFTVKYSIISDIGCKSDTSSHSVTLNNPPVANFATTGPYCAGNTINFTDNSSTGVNVWSWNFGDGGTSSSQNPTHTYATAGTYTVTLTASAGGCSSLPYTFNVTIFPKPTSNFSFPNTVCLPSGATQFTDLSTSAAGNTISNWLWDFGDASATSALQNPLHIYTGVGPYPANLTVTTDKGCTDSKTQSINTIFAEPQAAFNSLPAVCVGSLIGFADASSAPGSTISGWNWNFGDPLSGANNTSALQNPSHIYNTPGTYTITLSVTSATGCQSVNKIATGTVIVEPLPTAGINGNKTVCLNSPSPDITFTGGGTAPFIFTYNINGGADKTVTTISGNSVTVSVPTNTVGIFTYNLISVKEVNGAGCVQTQTGSATVTVNPLPTAIITGTTIACLNSTQPSISFTGASGTAPYTFTYNINGGPNQTITTTTGNTATVNAPTGTAGIFVYNLVSVQEGSANLCSQAQTGSATITVNALPTAAIAGSTEVCLNSTSPSVTFTGELGTVPYTFTYNVNGGANQTITTTSGNSVTVAVPTTSAGTFIYNLVSVQEGSANLCSQPQTGSASFIINPLPSGDFNPGIPSCESGAVSFTDISIANAGTINTWLWDFSDPSSGAANAASIQNPSHTFANAGNYDVKLIVTTDKGCVSPEITKQVTINSKPKGGFIAPQACTSDNAATFTDTSSVLNGSITAWEWNFGDANATSGNPNTSTLQNPTHWYTVMGSYTATLIVTSNNGCKDTIQQTFYVNGSVLNADFVVQNQASLCSNKEVVIQDASSIEGSLIRLEIYWDYLNDPTIKTIDMNPAAGSQYNHVYQEFGSPASKTYRIRYVAYTGINCVKTTTKDITVLATPTLQFDTIAPVCSNVASFQVTQVQLLNGLPGSGAFSGAGITDAGVFDPALASAGSHILRYTFNANNGCVNYIERAIDVYQTPVANAGPDKVVLEGGQVMLSPAQDIGSIVTYLWAPVTGLNDPTLAFATATPTEDITYTLTVTSDKNCFATDQVFVKVLKKVEIPNIFSPNGDGVHDKWMIQYLESYPGCTVDIYNRYGQQIYHSVGYDKPWDGTVNGKPVPIGTYYYIVNPRNGRSQLSGYVDVIR